VETCRCRGKVGATRAVEMAGYAPISAEAGAERFGRC